ncbi:MAG: acetylornithine deacetylase [Candidatus Bathyarchaeota archaeon B63]|nr:MAG: acetylornithine deacetylase [Candidatus Bathyarchaeota archaeon B63]
MKDEESVSLLRRMLEVYSPTGREERLADLLEDEMAGLGLRGVRRDGAGNVYGEAGSGGFTVLLCGHIDTVRGWIPVRLRDGRLYGRGAVDAKSSLAAMISAAAALSTKLDDHGKVIVAGVVDEEGEARGIRQLIRENLGVGCAIFGEPSGLGNVTFAYKGSVKLELTVRTSTGHVGAQHLYRNAVEEAYELWRLIKGRCEEYRSPHGVFYSLSASLTGIRSRRTTGGVPDRCLLEVDLRLPPKISSEEAIRIIGKPIQEFLDGREPVSVSTRILDRVEPFVAGRDTKVMKALREAILEVTGKPARLLRKTGTGDMNIFGREVGVPVATYGPGDSRLSHTSMEYIDIQEFLMSIRVYTRAVEKILAEAP